jgi:autophagy-related protein 9
MRARMPTLRLFWRAQALLFLEEMASIVVTPFILYFSLPKCAPAILAFMRDFTVHVPGVGDICSLAAFDFQRHGNPKYGSPARAPKVAFPPPLGGLQATSCMQRS